MHTYLPFYPYLIPYETILRTIPNHTTHHTTHAYIRTMQRHLSTFELVSKLL